jgi:cytochrome c biogenesis protein CcdA
MVLFIIPCVLVLVLSYFLNIDTFYKNAGEIFIALFMFGLGFMQLNYLVGYLFSTVESAFKYQIVVMALIYGLKAISHVVDVFLANRRYIERKHYHEIEMFFLDVSPFECLRELMALCLGDPNAELRSNEQPVTREQCYAL